MTYDATAEVEGDNLCCGPTVALDDVKTDLFASSHGKAPATSDHAVAQVEHVSHRYGATVALNDVTINIPAHRMIGVIGPDGVGKSTLLGLIAGVRIIQQGHVRVFDGNMADKAHRTAQGARIAYMPQGLGRNLYPTLSVFENIDFHG